MTAGQRETATWAGDIDREATQIEQLEIEAQQTEELDTDELCGCLRRCLRLMGTAISRMRHDDHSPDHRLTGFETMTAVSLLSCGGP